MRRSTPKGALGFFRSALIALIYVIGPREQVDLGLDIDKYLLPEHLRGVSVPAYDTQSTGIGDCCCEFRPCGHIHA